MYLLAGSRLFTRRSVTRTKRLRSFVRPLKCGIGNCFDLNADVYWIPLRDDPRYKEIVKRLNLPR